jgi:hypothetical protein
MRINQVITIVSLLGLSMALPVQNYDSLAVGRSGKVQSYRNDLGS